MFPFIDQLLTITLGSLSLPKACETTKQTNYNMPPSAESAALKSLFQSLSANFPHPDTGNVFLERTLYDQVSTVSTEPGDVTYSDRRTTGESPVRYLWISPKDASNHHAMLFLHGGGFSFGSPGGSHRKLAGHLAKACGMPAASVDYRLTPAHPHPAAVDDCVNVYRHLIEDLGFKSSNIILCGDSCGGGLATTVPLALAQLGLPKPGASIALSPWYDHTNSGPSREYNAEKDSMTQLDFSNKLAGRYNAGRTSLKDPLISPLFASKEELAKAMPPHWISVAGHDTLRCDGEEMAEKLREAGGEAELRVGEGMQHVFEFMAGKAVEADESVTDIGKWVRGKMDI